MSWLSRARCAGARGPARAARPTRRRALRAGRRPRRVVAGSRRSASGCALSARRRLRAAPSGPRSAISRCAARSRSISPRSWCLGVEELARDARLARDRLEADRLAGLIETADRPPRALDRPLAAALGRLMQVRWCPVQAASSFSSSSVLSFELLGALDDRHQVDPGGLVDLDQPLVAVLLAVLDQLLGARKLLAMLQAKTSDR